LTGSQALSITGIMLTLAGGVVVLYRDLRPRKRTYAEVLYGFPAQEGMDWISPHRGWRSVGDSRSRFFIAHC
jgi:hypothetical protein